MAPNSAPKMVVDVAPVGAEFAGSNEDTRGANLSKEMELESEFIMRYSTTETTQNVDWTSDSVFTAERADSDIHSDLCAVDSPIRPTVVTRWEENFPPRMITAVAPLTGPFKERAELTRMALSKVKEEEVVIKGRFGL